MFVLFGCINSVGNCSSLIVLILLFSSLCLVVGCAVYWCLITAVLIIYCCLFRFVFGWD